MQNPNAVRENIIKQMRDIYPGIYDRVIAPIRSYVAFKEVTGGALPEMLNRARQDTDAVLTGTRTALEAIHKNKEEGERILAAMREASALSGTSKFAGIFAAQSKIHKAAAILWGTGSVVAAILIGFFLNHILTQLTDALRGGDDVKITLQVFLAKVLLLSFFSIVFYQIVKNYNANMHLYTQQAPDEQP